MAAQADEILPNLWLGNCEAAESPFLLLDNKITHILSLLTYPIIVPVHTVKHKLVQILDKPGEDLLGELDEILAFIDEGLTSGGCVLVHCAMGVSRSSSVVIAYLMNKEKCTLQSALHRVAEKHPQTQPNEGFMEQLKLFEAMGCRCDPMNAQFKQHRLVHLAEEIHSRDQFPPHLLASDPHNSEAHDNKADSVYRCRKCRRALFRQSSVIGHNMDASYGGPNWHKQFKGKGQGSWGGGGLGDSASRQCTSVFIEPVTWMESFLLGVVEGKISCPKCNSRLGSFNWSGQQCSCGAWMTPGLQIHVNRVDHMVSQPGLPGPSAGPPDLTGGYAASAMGS